MTLCVDDVILWCSAHKRLVRQCLDLTEGEDCDVEKRRVTQLGSLRRKGKDLIQTFEYERVW